MITAIALALHLAAAPPQPAYWAAARHLAHACADDAGKAWCYGYINGAEDMWTAGTGGKPAWCAPEGTKASELGDAFVIWYAVNEDEAQSAPAVKALLAALSSTYPCKPKAPPKTVKQVRR